MRSMSSSTDRIGNAFSTDPPRWVMRAAVDSIDSTIRPLRFSRERSSSCGVAGSRAQRSSSPAITAIVSARFSGRVPR